MNNNLLIIGAGQRCQSAKEIAESMKYFDVIKLLDNENKFTKLDDYKDFSKDYSYAFAAFDDSEVRMEWIQKLEEYYIITYLLHSTAAVSPSAYIGKGTMIEAGAVINTASVVSKGCIVSSGVMIDHEAFVREGCFLDCGSIIKAKSVVLAGMKVKCGTIFESDVFARCPDNYFFEIGVY